MIRIPQSVVRECHAVFRHALPKSGMARASTMIEIVSGRDGIRLRMSPSDVAIEHHYPSASEPDSLTIPWTALVDSEGRGKGPVECQRAKGDKVEVTWEQAGVPFRREYGVREPQPFPAWPGRDVANEPSMAQALEYVMQIPTGGSGRISLTCVQLRGKQGDIAATDGRQLLVQGGFKFPWKDAILLPRTAIFAARELRQGDVVRVAQSKTHVFFRIGGWTIALRIETATRFPNVDGVIPKAAGITTRWFVGADEAPALAAMLDKLPAAKDEQVPVTLDLTKPIVLRTRAEDEKRCTDLVLLRSSLEGKATRLAVDRRLLQRALEMDFHSFQITDAEKPILCQEGKRVYVCTVLDPKSALAPQAGAIRVMLPATADKSRRTIALPEQIERPVPAIAASSAPSRDRSVLAGFFASARSLWDLALKHHKKSA